MAKNRLILALLFFMVTPVHAGTITMPQYNTNDILTSTNLNQRFNLPTNVLNGGLDNENANIDDGFRFIEILSSLPAAGNQGRVVYNTGNDTLNFDTGTGFLGVAMVGSGQTFTGNNTFSGTTTFSGAVTTTSTLTANGNTTLNGTTNSIGNGGSDTLTFNLGGNITYTPAMTWTFTANQTVSGTWADLGIVTTVDINGGTMDDVNVDGATATGMLYVNDASDNFSQLGAQGSSGEILESAGAGANPTFVGQDWQFVSKTTWSGATATTDIAISQDVTYKVVVRASNATASNTELGLRFNSDSGSHYAGANGEAVTASSSITLAAAMDASGSNGWATSEFIMNTVRTDQMSVGGTTVYQDGGANLATYTVGGWWDNSDTVASFEVIGDQNCSGTVLLYRLIET